MILAAPTCLQVCWWDWLLPGELLYSYAARLAGLNSLNPPKRSLQVLFGSDTMIPSADLPTHLDDIFERLRPGGAFASVQDMVQRATLYPYYRFFLPASRWEAICAQARANDGGALKTMLGLVAGRCGATAILRSCDVCRRLALRRWGTVYWQTVHQLPGMAVCPVHGSVLVNEVRQSALPNRQQLLLPSDALPPEASPDIPGNPLQLRLARLSQQVLNFQAIAPLPQARWAAYRGALDDLGMLTAQGHIRWARLLDALTEHLAGQVPGPTLIGRAGWTTPATWAASALSSRDRFVHPLVHLVMIDFLFGSLERFLRAASAPRALDVPVVEPQRPEAPELLDASLSCAQVSQALGCSVHTVMKRRCRLGLAVQRRPSRVKPRLREAIAKDLRTGAPVRQVARKYRVSLSSAYRILSEPSVAAARQEAGVRARRGSYRSQWQQACRSHAGPGTKVVRSAAPAAYAWLRRHDRAWLVAHRPAKTAPPAARKQAVDWDARDKDLAQRAKVAASTYGATHAGRPISATRLLSLVYNGSSARRHASQLPRLWRQVNRLTSRGKGASRR